MTGRRATAMLAAAVLGAVAGWALRLATEPPPADGSGEDLRARVEDLERENRDLLRRAEMARAARRSEAEAAPTAPGDSPTAVPDGPRTASRFAPGGADPFAPRTDLPSDAKGLATVLRDAVARGDEALAQAVQVALSALGGAAVDELTAILRDPAAPAALLQRTFEILANLDAPGLAALAEEIVARPGTSAALRQGAMRAAVTADPASALGVLQRLLWSPSAADVDLGRDALGWTSDRTFLPLLTEESRRTDRTRNIHGILTAISRIKDRPWSAFQLTGEPDTTVGGDIGTAWASKSEQMGRVWIETDYETAVRPDLVRIRETHNAGAVVKIEGKLAGGAFETLWEGTAAPAETPRWFEPSLSSSSEAVRTIRVTLDTDRVPGWNEVDAVELVGGGLRQWATAARASSSYAD